MMNIRGEWEKILIWLRILIIEISDLISKTKIDILSGETGSNIDTKSTNCSAPIHQCLNWEFQVCNSIIYSNSSNERYSWITGYMSIHIYCNVKLKIFWKTSNIVSKTKITNFPTTIITNYKIYIFRKTIIPNIRILN